jgi:hypothetical protein
MALRYADTVSTGAAVITPHLGIDWREAFADLSATFSQFTIGGWSLQGLASGSSFIPINRQFLGEISLLAGGSTHNDGTRTGEIVGNARLHIPISAAELFIGSGVGRTWDGLAWRSIVLGELGAAIGSTDRGAVISFTPTTADSINYADLQGSFSWSTDVADLGAVVGTRVGDQLTTLSGNVRSWASVSAVRRLNSRFAISLSGGSYPIDPTQGFPGGRFLSLEMRLTTGRAPVSPAPVPGTGSLPGNAPVPAGFSFETSRDSEGRVTFLVNAPDAQSVEINGDFTQWTPLRLTQSVSEPGRWTAVLPIAPGKYEMNIRIDGGKWMVPPGLLSLLDEFGGAVGLLVIE